MPTPFTHQKEMLAFHMAHFCTLDNSEVGCGKTGPVVVWLRRMVDLGEINAALVVCPNSIITNWQNEIKMWSDLESVALVGTKQKRLALLKQPFYIYIINYEGVRVIHKELMAKGFDAVIADEIHHIKQYKGSKNKPTQSFLVRELGGNARFRKGMTGTLLTNSLEDIWAIAKFVSPDIFKGLNFWGFRNRYLYDANAGKSWMKWPDMKPRPGAAEEIREKLRPYTIRFEKKDVLQWLPPVLFQKRMVEMGEEQHKAYKELKQHFLTELKSEQEQGPDFILTAPYVLLRITKLLEIANGFVYKEGEKAHHFKQNSKLTELKNLLEEIGDKRVVIWCAFREEIEMIYHAISHEDSGLTFHGASIYWDKDTRFRTLVLTGNTESELRQPIVDAFNTGKFQYLITNPAVGGEGLTILAPYVIYYSRSWKLGERIQSLGRHHRPGAEKYDNISVIDLVTQDTVDQDVMKALESKEDLLKSVTPETFKRMIQ